MMIRVIALLLFIGRQIYPVVLQTIAVSVSGAWTEDSAVTLTCTISPYGGLMKWLLDSTDVAQCKPTTCYQSVTDEGAFLFGFDTDNHIFTWTIDPVKLKYNGNVFKCFDGTKTTNITAEVQQKQETTTKKPYSDTLSIPAIAISCVFALLVLGVAAVIYYLIKRHSPGDNGERELLNLDTKIGTMEKGLKDIKNAIGTDKTGKTRKLEPMETELDHLNTTIGNEKSGLIADFKSMEKGLKDIKNAIGTDKTGKTRKLEPMETELDHLNTTIGNEKSGLIADFKSMRTEMNEIKKSLEDVLTRRNQMKGHGDKENNNQQADKLIDIEEPDPQTTGKAESGKLP